MLICAKTDIGKSRNENQDAFAVGQLTGGIFGVVCDGMGGAAGGRIAGTTAAEVFSSVFTELCEADGEQPIDEKMVSAAQKANNAVYSLALLNPELHGMGTTIVACTVMSSQIYLIHAGDSRAYLLRDGVLSQLTKDHSMVQMLVDDGYISEEQAQTHAYKNIITRALGTEEQVDIDTDRLDALEGDMILLCSDGLSNCVPKEKMVEILLNNEFDAAAEALIDAANENGGGDNITAVILKV